MKAEFNGVTVEGTPQEIAELIKLVGEIKGAPVYVPYQHPYQPWPEVRPYPVTWGRMAACHAGDSCTRSRTSSGFAGSASSTP